jgi:5-formaminoimidazole-4-carboxamide-1-beta-D-ribofuranosyl 5'-monophosphate synthetase
MLIKGNVLVRYAMKTVMLGSVGSHSCKIIWLTALSFGLNSSRRQHDVGFAEFPGITEYVELRLSKNMLELRGS